ncbi:MAG: hypothetical protein ACXWVM_12845 [Polyangiales bacterium]
MRTTLRVAAALSVVLTLQWSVPAFAESAPALTVQLKTGATYHGELVERVPGDHVTLKLATGEVRRFEWSDIVEVPNSPESAPAAPSSVPTSTWTTLATPNDGPYVHIETKTHGVVLERMVASAEYGSSIATVWRVVCSAPCDQPVEAGDRYRLGGRGLRTSKEFSVTENTYLKANLGRRGSFYSGIGLFVASIPLTMLGIAALSEGKDKTHDAALGVTVTGALLAVIGIALIATNTNSVTKDGVTIGSTGVKLSPRGFVF